MSPRSKKIAEMMRGKTRKAILSASLELFAKHGYSATTADEIARKAGISKGLIFTHFGKKQDILFAILDEHFDRILPNFFRSNDPRPAKEKLVSLVNTWLQMMKTEPLFARLSLQLNLDDAFRRLVRTRKVKEYYRDFLLHMRKMFKELGSDKPELDTFILMFLFDGIVANYTVAPEMFPVDSIKDHLVDLLILRRQNTGA